MTAAEDQGWKPHTEGQRLAAKSPRFCSTCKAWANHFADEHEDYDVATSRDDRWCSTCREWTSHTARSHEAQGENG